MKCQCCGSEELVWDYKNGAVVCSSCGCVADIIYDAHTYSNNGSVNRVAERLYRLQRMVRRKMVKEAMKRFELEKRGYILVNGVVIHSRSLAALRIVESNSAVKEHVERGLRILEAFAPTKLSRSIRSRYALAYAVAKMMRNEDVSAKELTLFSIGKSTAARVVNEAKQILEKTKLCRYLEAKTIQFNDHSQ